MSNNRPTAPEVPSKVWQELYKAAANFREIAPWDWMHDVHMLGFRDARGLRIACVLGRNRELFGLVVYRGIHGARLLLDAIEGRSGGDIDRGLIQDSVMTSYGNKSELEKPDKDVIQKIKFRPWNNLWANYCLNNFL
jgi:hypothetical protein